MQRPKIFKKRAAVPSGAKVINAFDGPLRELFFVNNPKFKKGTPEATRSLKKFLAAHKIKGVWVYYPWSNKVVYSLPEDLYFKLRTSRNRDLITEKEQKNYRNTKVGVAGLSVGSAVVSALVISGGPKVLKIADYDVIEVSNLNRIRAKLIDVGVNKTLVVAKEVWEMDPFAKLHLWESGINKNTLKEFILGRLKLDVFIDEMDSLDLKFLARLICKKAKIPVLMATDNGDDVLLDVERSL